MIGQIVFYASLAVFAAFWIWAIGHAASTPKATRLQRVFWAGSMFVNPSTAVWYWYIWKRWVFWFLFTPMLGAFASFPFIVRSAMKAADATTLTNILFALGHRPLLVFVAALMVFPMILRLAALLHLGKNTELTALDRNDWIVAFALPIFGFGAGLAYCAKYQKSWAMASLIWWVVLTLSTEPVIRTTSQALTRLGEVQREQFKKTQP